MDVTKYKATFHALLFLLSIGIRSCMPQDGDFKPMPQSDENHPKSCDYESEAADDCLDAEQKKIQECNPRMTFRVLTRSMINGNYRTNPRVARLSNSLFDCNPDGFEDVMNQVVSAVRSQSSLSLITIMDYIGSHSYSDQIVRGLRVVFQFIKRDNLLDSSEIRKLARMLKNEEDKNRFKDGRTSGILQNLKKELPQKIREEVWGEEEEKLSSNIWDGIKQVFKNTFDGSFSQ